MPAADLLRLFGPFDLAALALLGVCYVAMGRLIEHPTPRRQSVTVLVAAMRRRWMREFARREQRIFDSQIVGNLRNSTSFFASTTVIVIGGVLALAGNADRIGSAADELVPGHRPVEVYQTKLLLVALLLVAGFLRFVWSNRIFGYCAVAMAAVPSPGDPQALPMALRAAELNVRAAYNFNRGLRAVYFALAAAAWLLGPAVLALATLVTAWVLWQHEFASDTHRILSEGAEE